MPSFDLREFVVAVLNRGTIRADMMDAFVDAFLEFMKGTSSWYTRKEDGSMHFETEDPNDVAVDLPSHKDFFEHVKYFMTIDVVAEMARRPNGCMRGLNAALDDSFFE